jgi:HEAT repeat protein
MNKSFTYDVFISHSSKDKAVLRPLAEQLRKDGLKVWYDEWEIKPGDSIFAKIEEGLEHSRILILCMSSNAFGSDWAQLETGTFRFRDPLNKERRFIPLLLDNSKIIGSISQFLYIDYRPDVRDREYSKLLEVCSNPETWWPRSFHKSDHDDCRNNHFENPMLIPLMEALMDVRPEVRSAAAFRLGEMGEDSFSAVPTLVSMLSKECPFYKGTVGTALGHIGILAYPSLIDLIPNADYYTASEIKQAIEIMGISVIPLILEDLNDHRPVVRKFCVSLVGEIAGVKVLDSLVKALSDKDYEVRATAASALGKIGKLANNAVPSLIKALQDPDPDVRSSASLAIGMIGHDQAVPFLISVLHDPNDQVRAAAIESLGELGTGAKDAIKELINCLQDSDDRVRENCVWTLGRIGPLAIDSIPALERALEDKYWGVHQNVPATLGKIGPQALDVLIRALSHRNYHIRGRAVEAIGSFGKTAEKAIDHLVPLLNDRVEYVVTEAIFTLGEIRKSTPSVGLALCECIRSSKHEIKAAGIRAAGRIGLLETANDLIEATYDKDEVIRASAIRAISRIKITKAIPRIKELLEDINQEVRDCAKTCLSEIDK